MDVGPFLRKGIAVPLGTDRRNFVIRKHANGGIVVEIGSETVLLSPRQAFEMALGFLRAANIEVHEEWDAASLKQRLPS